MRFNETRGKTAVVLTASKSLNVGMQSGSGSGSGYVHRRSQSMPISSAEQGESKICGFYIRPPLAQSDIYEFTLG